MPDLNTNKMRFVIRLTNEEYQTVKLKSQILGFNSLSAFAREKLFKNTLPTETKIKEIYYTIINPKWHETKKS